MSHVLVIEDDSLISELLSITLSEEGHEFMTAFNGANGLHLLQQTPFDLILLDMNMPIMDGWQFLAAYRLLFNVPPVVLCTALNMSWQEVRDLGAINILYKPFVFDDLFGIIEQHLRV